MFKCYIIHQELARRMYNFCIWAI